jgi:hypothetical protein
MKWSVYCRHALLTVIYTWLCMCRSAGGGWTVCVLWMTFHCLVYRYMYTVHVHVSERYHRCYAFASCFNTRNYSTSTKYLNIYSVLYTTGGGIFILPSYLTSYTGTNARIVVLHIHSYHSILPLSQKLLAIFWQNFWELVPKDFTLFTCTSTYPT